MNPNLQPTPIDHPSYQPTPIPDSPNPSSSKSSSPPGSPHSNLHSRLIQLTPLDLDQLHHPLLPPPSDRHLFQQIINNRFLLGCAFFASLGGILFGYDQGVISVTLVMDHFLSRFPDVDEHRPNGRSASFWKGFLTAMIELGAVVGVTLAGFIADQHGRKSAIRIGAVLFIVGSTIQTAAMDFLMLLLGRFVAGIGVGFLTMTCPMYMCEISPSNIRGALLCLEEFNIVFGIVIAVWTTYATRLIDSEFSWRFPFGIQLIPAFIILLGLNLLPSSPSWLASHKKHQECLQALSVLRQLPAEDQSVKREWIDIRVEAEFQHEHDLVRFGELPSGFWPQLTVEFRKWQDTFSKSYRKRTLVGVGLTFFQQFVGINVCSIHDRTSFL